MEQPGVSNAFRLELYKSYRARTSTLSCLGLDRRWSVQAEFVAANVSINILGSDSEI